MEYDFKLVYDGTNQPTVTEYILSNVTDELVTHSFYVTGTNFNGEGAASAVARLRSCTRPSSGVVAAENFPGPVIDAVSSTSVTISWRAPKEDGGCPILGYAIYLANAGAALDASSEYDSVNVRDKPLLSSYSIDMQSQVPGQTYQIRVGAINRIGEVPSDTTTVLLASVPETPAAPTKKFLNATAA